MRFSIIIPAYNAENHIRKALDSIKQQKFTDYELIVVCDSCTDNTKSIAEEYGAVTDVVNYHQDGFTRNRGMELAQGEYILFMDDDDWWLHEYVLTQLDAKLTELHSPDILCFSFIFKGWKYAEPCGNDGRHWIAVWNKCWKRACIGNSKFSNVHSTSDVNFHNSMFSKCLDVKLWDMPMYYYNYMREGSITETDKRSK